MFLVLVSRHRIIGKILDERVRNVSSIMKFYLKLRQIIRDGEKLQAARDRLSELVFQRRLKALEQRLDALLEWKNLLLAEYEAGLKPLAIAA